MDELAGLRDEEYRCLSFLEGNSDGARLLSVVSLGADLNHPPYQLGLPSEKARLRLLPRQAGPQ
jgi:hypothetical protein